MIGDEEGNGYYQDPPFEHPDSYILRGFSIVDKSGKQIEWALTERRALNIIRDANNAGLKLEIKQNDKR